MKILIVEDEPSLREIMVRTLTREQYIVEQAADYAAALDKIAAYDYDCILLDIMLPGGSGLRLLEELKRRRSPAAVIIISARDSLDDKIEGLELGADDYLPKPFHLAELSARIRSVLRRHQRGGYESLDAGNVRLWPDSRRVEVAGREVELLRKEYDILHYFMSRPNHTVDKTALAEGVWGDHIDQADNFDFVYAQMKNLRRKLHDAGADIEIRAVYGFGYKLVQPYFTLIDEINDEVDDALEARAEVIVKRVLAGRELPVPADEGNNGYFLHEVSPQYAAAQHHERYSDEEIFIPERDDKEPARVLRKLFRDGAGQWRELTVMTPTIEKDDLRESILRWMVCLYLFLLMMILLVTVIVLYRTMRPLYALLRWLDGYTVGARNAPLAVETSVTEFRKLNDAARRYAERAESSFERQKQFIGNASHEMQTPLAVCRNRLEMLVDDAHALTGEQLGEIAKVQRTLDYLVRLNRSLLLLSKIDNGQFPEAEEVDVNALVRRTAEDMEEIYAYRSMRFALVDEGPLTARMNPSLAGSVVANLLKNAFVHGDEGGEVTVRVAPRRFTVCNSGAGGPLDAGRIFDRFYQGTKKEGSTGLGLAVVDAVCRLYGLKVSYSYKEGRHCFAVDFPA